MIRQSVLHRPADLTALKEKHDSEAEEEEVMEEEQEGEEEEERGSDSFIHLNPSGSNIPFSGRRTVLIKYKYSRTCKGPSKLVTETKVKYVCFIYFIFEF